MSLLRNAGIGWLITIIVVFAAWLTHVITTIKAAAWLFLIAGAIFAPIGIVHGIATWFGATWV